MKDADIRQLRVAIVYDWLDSWGGVERVLMTMHEMIPQAHYFTSFYDLEKAPWAKNLPIHPSFMQRLPRSVRNSRILSLPFFPYAFEDFNFSGYDIVLSVSSSYAKSIITKPPTAHLCYLLTPSRYLWLYAHPAAKKVPSFFFKQYEKYMRGWDMIASTRPDQILSISETVAARCTKIYGRDSAVIYPPFDVAYWDSLRQQSPRGIQAFVGEDEFYLVVSRLEPYKKVDIVVDAFRRLENKKIVIVGTGSERNRLQGKSAQNIHFLEKISDGELKWLYMHAKALVMPQEEDFGYVSLEAQLQGLPVIAYGRGGARETVVEGKTGLFFPEQTVESFSSTLARFDKISYNFRHGVKELGPLQAKKYAKDQFVSRMRNAITNSVLHNREAQIQ